MTVRVLHDALRRLRARDPAARLFPFALACLFGFSTLANEMTELETEDLDQFLHGFFSTHPMPLLERIMAAMSWIGGEQGITLALIVSIGLFWALRRRSPQAVTLLVDGAAGWLVIQLAKTSLFRLRPAATLDWMGSSFPSGHAFDALTVYGLLTWWLAREWPRWRHGVAVAGLLLIVSIGVSRIILGFHYAADVFGGYMLGGAWLFVCVAMGEWMEERVSRADAP